MIALILALAIADPAGIDGLPLTALPPQSLPQQGCAAYLFSTGTARSLLTVAQAAAGTLRLTLDGKTQDFARGLQSGPAGFGFARITEYRLGDVAITLDLTIEARRDLVQGAVIDSGTLRIDRPGQDGVVVPVAGLIGCAAP